MHGMFDDERDLYKEGDTVNLNCSEGYFRTPTDGKVVCGASGWNVIPNCAPSELLDVDFL